MLRCGLCTLLKAKRVVPMGYSRSTFYKKLRSPRASKPWRDRSATSAGRIELVVNSDVVTDDGSTVMGNLTTAGPLGVRTAHLAPHVATANEYNANMTTTSAAAVLDTQALYGADAGVPRAVLPPSSSSVSTSSSSQSAAALLPPDSGDDHGAVATTTASPSSDAMSVLPIGDALDVTVARVQTYADGAVPIHLQQYKRTRREAAEATQLPRHLNRLFHKIMGWSSELVELEDEDKDSAQPSSSSSSSSSPVRRHADAHDEQPQMQPQMLRKKMHNLTDTVKYGLLLEAHEKDKFALENKLQLAGTALERRLLTWEGLRVLDQAPADELASTQRDKTAIVLEAPASFRVPVVNRDCCPGCGALLQDTDEGAFGYVTADEVARYVALHEERVRLRHEYATRMAELQAHWAKHGRRVGEEWLDFMTEDEFRAFYKTRSGAFVCGRCHALRHLGVHGQRTVWSAPDFTAQLRALRERRCVVVLVVDVTDFPGSMVYDLPGLISMNNPVIVCVNKMDCVRNRSFNYGGRDTAVAARLVSPRYVRRWVLDMALQFQLPRHCIRDVVPVSATRGWHMAELLTAIERAANLDLRQPHAPLPTYFVGAANVGKSSVINALARHLCVPQPPHPRSRKVYYTLRDRASGRETVHWRWYTPPNVNRAEMRDVRAQQGSRNAPIVTTSSLPGTTVAVNAVRLSLYHAGGGGGGGSQHGDGDESSRGSSRGADEAAVADGDARRTWDAQTYFYDTPGVLPHWHRHSPLTLLQMRRTLIRAYRHPQSFLLAPGHTIFLGGLAAVDVVKGPAHGLLFMLYTSHKVRSAIVDTARSDAFWHEQLGRALYPPGSHEQLQSLSDAASAPTLRESRSYYFECYARHRLRPKADVYVCGLGWVSFCVSEQSDVVLRVRTLPGVVHGVREPLRYNELRGLRRWPRLLRRFTFRGLHDVDEPVDKESVGTVVRLTAGTDDGSNGNTTHGNDEGTHAASAAAAAVGDATAASRPATTSPASSVLQTLRTVTKPAPPPSQRDVVASSAPFAALVRELQMSGKV